jgi:hypothetical protein
MKKVDVKKKRGGGNILKKKLKKNKGSNIGCCPQVPVMEIYVSDQIIEK